MRDKNEINLAIWVGTADKPASPAEADGVRVVAVNLEEMTPEKVVDAFNASGLTAKDFRSNVAMFVNAGVDPAAVAVGQCGLSALAGRTVQVFVAGKSTALEGMDATLRRERRAKPDHVDADLQVAGTSNEMPVVSIAGTPADIRAAMTRIHFAKRVYLTALSDPMNMAVTSMVVAALRARNEQDRLPVLVRATGEHVDLSAVRAALVDMRRKTSVATAELAEPAPVSERLARLAEAEARPIGAVLEMLGTKHGPENKNVWHCSRPDRHTNGDRVPSMRETNGKVRCMRCDAEKVGPVRLVADTLSISPDQAADHILASVAPGAPSTDH